MLWNAFRAAILPVALAEAADVLARFIQHLGRSNERVRQPAVERFLALLATKTG